MSKFNLAIKKNQFQSLQLDDDCVIITGIDSENFIFPETVDSDDVARILAKEEIADLENILFNLKEELKKQNFVLTFKIKEVRSHQDQ
jgi:hypothetical protein